MNDHYACKVGAKAAAEAEAGERRNTMRPAKRATRETLLCFVPAPRDKANAVGWLAGNLLVGGQLAPAALATAAAAAEPQLGVIIYWLSSLMSARGAAKLARSRRRPKKVAQNDFLPPWAGAESSSSSSPQSSSSCLFVCLLTARLPLRRRRRVEEASSEEEEKRAAKLNGLQWLRFWPLGRQLTSSRAA